MHQIILRLRQYASNKQPKEEIPVYMTHCFEQILTLASQHFPLYHFPRLPKSYIILQSRQHRQNKLDKLFGLLISLPTASVNLLSKRRKKKKQHSPSTVPGSSYSEKYQLEKGSRQHVFISASLKSAQLEHNGVSQKTTSANVKELFLQKLYLGGPMIC